MQRSKQICLNCMLSHFFHIIWLIARVAESSNRTLFNYSRPIFEFNFMYQSGFFSNGTWQGTKWLTTQHMETVLFWIETLGKVWGLNLIVMLQILAGQFSKILVFPPSYNVHMIPCIHNNYKSISQNGNQIARLGHQACLQVTRVMTTEKWIWRCASVWTRFQKKKGCGAQ